MDNSTKNNISKLVTYLENFNPEMCDKNTISELDNTSNLIQMDVCGNNPMVKELKQNHAKFAIFEKSQPQISDKINYKSSIDVNKMNGVIESEIWKNGPNSNSLFETYENKKNNLMKNEENLNFQKKGKF